jgi:hypothetical protein
MDRHKSLRNAAYVCQRLALLGGILWALNCVIFFIQYFSAGMQIPSFREVVEGYGGALIATIVSILLLYAAGGVIGLLLDIEANTRKST